MKSFDPKNSWILCIFFSIFSIIIAFILTLFKLVDILGSIIFPLTLLPVLITLPEKPDRKGIIFFIGAFLSLIIIASIMDYWVLTAFNNELSDVWDKSLNLYWYFFFTLFLPISFLLLAAIYKWNTKNAKMAVKIYIAAILIGYIFSLEDIFYYPLGMLHNLQDPLVSWTEWWQIEWSWLVRYTYVFGRPIRTWELLLISVLGTLLMFFWIRNDISDLLKQLRNKNEDEEEINNQTPQIHNHEKSKNRIGFKVYFLLWSIGVFAFIILYWLFWDLFNTIGFWPLGILFFFNSIMSFLIIRFNFNLETEKKLHTFIFMLIIIIYLLFTELDWWVVEEGFHNVPTSISTILISNHYRITIWFLLLPGIMFLFFILFQILTKKPNKQLSYYYLITLLILFSGLDILVVLIYSGHIPEIWAWNHYIFVFTSVPLNLSLIFLWSIITILIVFGIISYLREGFIYEQLTKYLS